MNKNRLSFNASLNNSASDRDFFLSLDATIPLEWKVDFTLLASNFCCGASSQCSLPKLSTVIGSGANIVAPETVNALTFARSYFDKVATMDNMLVLQRQQPHLYSFYQSFSNGIYLSKLNNADIVRQAKILVEDFSFRGIMEVKVSALYARNPETLWAVLEALKAIHPRSPIQFLTMSVTENPELSNGIAELVSWADATSIAYELVSEADLLAEEDKTHLDTTMVEPWEEHSIVLIQNRFYLSKHDSLHGDSYFYRVDETTDPMAFLVGMLRAKVGQSFKLSQTLKDPRQLDYFTWLRNSVEVKENFNFIPGMMLEEGRYRKMLTTLAGFTETPAGIIKTRDDNQVVPLVSFRS